MRKTIAVLVLALSLPHPAYALTRCKVDDACGTCSATCTRTAICRASIIEPKSRSCLARAECLCVDQPTRNTRRSVARRPFSGTTGSNGQ